ACPWPCHCLSAKRRIPYHKRSIPMKAILIIGTRILMRAGLKYLISQDYREVTFGEAETPQHASPLLSKRQWDLIILDQTPPDKNAFPFLESILQQHPATRALVLCNNDSHAAHARKLGVALLVDKKLRRAELMKAVEYALAGKKN